MSKMENSRKEENRMSENLDALKKERFGEIAYEFRDGSVFFPEKKFSKPIENSYVFLNKNIICGEYPGDKDPDRCLDKLNVLVNFGITDFIDLTEEGELIPYADMLPDEVKHHRFPIPDVQTPECCEDVVPILCAIDWALNNGGKVYIHCWGGIGRTGLVAACYACWRKGCSGSEALALVAESFKDNPKSKRPNVSAPENAMQKEFVLRFSDFLNANGGVSKVRTCYYVKLCTGELAELFISDILKGTNSTFTDKLAEFRQCVNEQENSEIMPGFRGDLSCYLDVLTHLKMKSGYRLEYQQCGDEIGSAPYIDLEGLVIDKSAEGAWEAVLLYALGGQFNLRWHAGTLQHCIVTDWLAFYMGYPADEVSGEEVLKTIGPEPLAALDITPRVEIEGNEATVYYCIFNAWHGFSRIKHKVHFDTGKLDEPIEMMHVPYFCHVIF